MFEKGIIQQCKLDDGRLEFYDQCSDNSLNSYCAKNKNRYEYLGEGIVWKLNGILQEGIRKFHFYRRK